MSNNVLTSEETILRKYQLEPNDLYDYPASRVIKSLSTCPSASETRVVKAPKASSGEFVFDTQLGKTQFLSNVFKVHYRIPFIVTPTKWPTVTSTSGVTTNVVVTKDNFIKEIFNDNADICIAQQGMAQGENYSVISLNSQALNPVIEIPALSNITSPYYNTEDVNEYLQASQPDRFQSFDKYDGSANQSLKFYNEHCKAAYTTISPLNEQNIFASKYQSGYSTRTPQWEFNSSTTSSHVKVYCNFWSYTRFSIGSAPNDESTIPGIERFGLTTRLVNDFASKIFSIKQVAGVDRYASIVQDMADTENTEAWLLLKIISPPQYIRDEMFDKSSGLMKPFSIGYPRIECKPCDSQTVSAGAMASFNREGLMLGSVPRSIYIGLLKDRDGDFKKVTRTPINYGLIANLNITFESIITAFPNQISLDYLTNSNGYDEMDPLGKLIKGYPIKLNLGKDISLPKELVVGAAGSYNLSVSGNFLNQGEDEATYRLYIIIVSEATLEFDGTNFSQSSGVFVPTEILNTAFFLRDLYHEQRKELQVLGGGKFGDAMKWLGRNVAKIAKNAWENRDKIAGTVGDVMALAKTIKGGKIASNNTSGAGRGTVMLGAGNVRQSVFK